MSAAAEVANLALQVAALASIGSAVARIVRVESGLERGFAGLLASVAGLLTTMQVLGLLGVLRTPVLSAALLVVAVLAWVAARRVPSGPVATSPPMTRRQGVAILAAIALCAAWFSVSLGAYAPEFDTLLYHTVNAAAYWHSHGFWPLPFSEPGSYSGASPGNGELIAAWLMPVTGDDRLSYIVGLLGTALTVLGGAVVIREIHGRLADGALVLAAYLVMPLFLISQVRSLQVETMVTAGLVGALACGLVARRVAMTAGEGVASRRWLLLGGVALGVAAGSKIVALAYVAVTYLAMVTLQRSGRRWALLLMGAGALLSGSAWYVRNVIATGAPIPFTPAAASAQSRLIVSQRASLVIQILHGDLSGVARTAVIGGVAAGPLLLLVLWVVVAGVRRRDGVHRGLGWLAIALLAVYPLLPYSAGGVPLYDKTLLDALRYLLPPMAVALILAPAVMPARELRMAAMVCAGVGAATVVSQIGLDDIPAFAGRDAAALAHVAGVAIVIGCVIAAALWASARLRRRRVDSRALAPVAAALVAAVAATSAFTWPGPPGDPPVLAQALRETGVDGRLILAANVTDMRRLLGPDLDRQVLGIGSGAPGVQVPFADVNSFNAFVTAHAPAVVVIGSRANPELADSVPQGWTAPQSWHVEGPLDDDVVYYVPVATGGGAG